ncbi:tyrosine-type recombinase/integrase [Pelagibacterium luteolum]|uniref:Site-specific recombinase XerD n=1 Tax=Pelagibacterium luteolum TaxID=440168 RepID=A0A1G7YLG8_9HYPH|nr:site-specific integrase [Pelagibacterium luteolum]SDG97351.1 Site-specific recombinase XerD [Pelagibacterium luteolum]
MSDIRKRTGSKGTTYQVRYPSPGTKTGFSYATFDTMKEARAFLESGATRRKAVVDRSGPQTVAEATELWLRICEKEGLNGREPITSYTLVNYAYRSSFIKSYLWPRALGDLTTPDVVAFRSWLLRGEISRVVASKVLSSFHSVMKEMTIRGHISHNPAIGVSIRADSRYQETAKFPSRREIMALLVAADELANSKNMTIAKAWARYRPMLYLAVDSGMRPQEYIALAKSAISETGVLVERALDGNGRSISVTKTPAGRRFIDLSPDTLAMIRHYAEHLAVPNKYDLVFPSDNGRWQCRRNWQRRGFEVACEKAGLVEEVEIGGKTVTQVKYRPYDLRHFFASMLIERKVNLKKIQTLMGHSNIETTLNVYGHLLDEAEEPPREAIGLLGRLASGDLASSAPPRIDML